VSFERGRGRQLFYYAQSRSPKTTTSDGLLVLILRNLSLEILESLLVLRERDDTVMMMMLLL
jgi:hypothetical protein